MVKKMLFLGLIIMSVTLFGCSKTSDIADSTEVLKQTENDGEEYSDNAAWVVNMLFPAVECMLGEDILDQDVSYTDDGFIINDRHITYDEIENHIAECDIGCYLK